MELSFISCLLLLLSTAGLVLVNPGNPLDIVEVSRSHWRLSEDAGKTLKAPKAKPVDVLASDEDADEIMHVLHSLRRVRLHDTKQLHSWMVHCRDCFNSVQSSGHSSVAADGVSASGGSALPSAAYVAVQDAGAGHSSSNDNVSAGSKPSLSSLKPRSSSSTSNRGAATLTNQEPLSAAAAAAATASTPVTSSSFKNSNNVSCRPFINLTQFDHLPGVANRQHMVTYPEPEVAAIFRRNGRAVHLDLVARRLAAALAKKVVAAQTFNQVGNLLRVRGDSHGAVECFRRALALQPNNPDVLLNLARVLFNHNFLGDAIALTRRSLETQSPDRNAWLQHFTLGEILRAYGHFAEAAHHFRHAVALNPGFAPAQNHLKELEPAPAPPLTVYTFAIILFLVLGVLAGLLTTAEANLDAYGEVMKTQRHFNRAMAMKTLKLSINPKVVRSRRQN